MLEARKVVKLLDSLEHKHYERRSSTFSKSGFVDNVINEEKEHGKKYTRLELETWVAEAVAHGFISEHGYGNDYIATTPKGRNLLRPYGIGWLHFAEAWLAQFKTIGAFSLGVISPWGSKPAYILGQDFFRSLYVDPILRDLFINKPTCVKSTFRL